jgi:hypothetical protein
VALLTKASEPVKCCGRRTHTNTALYGYNRTYLPIDWPYHALPLYMKMDYLKMKIGYSKVKGSSQSFPGTGLNMFREPGRIFQELLILFVLFMMKITIAR